MATTDWDFRYTSWEKGSDFFVSTPTSLKITLPVGAQDNNLALLKESISGALDQGRIVSQIRTRSGTTQRPLFIFRAQVSNLNFWAYDQYEGTFQVGATEWRYRDANVRSEGSSTKRDRAGAETDTGDYINFDDTEIWRAT